MPQCVKHGDDYLRVGGFDLAGLRAERSDFILYMRDMANKLVSKLTQLADCLGKRGLEVKGPPGSGKSTTIWEWLLDQGRLGRSVLWVHLDEKGEDGSAVRIVGGQMSVAEFKTLDALDAAIQEDTYDVIVVDGVVATNVMKANSFVKPYTKTTFIVYATSQSVPRNTQDRLIRNMETFPFYPWTSDEYKAAVADEDFYNSVADILGGAKNADVATREELVEKKEYYAGKSGRWMFAMTTAAVLADIKYHVEQVDRFDSIIEKTGGTEAQIAQNHLMMTYEDGTSFIVSKRALRELIFRAREGSPDTALQRAYELAGNNKGHRGWVFELDFRNYLESKSEIKLTRTVVYAYKDTSPAATKTRNADLVKCDPESLNALGDDEKKKIKDGARLLPETERQAGWDAAYVEDRVLNLEQVTCGATHKYDMKHAKALGDTILRILPAGSSFSGYRLWTIAPSGTKTFQPSVTPLAKDTTVLVSGSHFTPETKPTLGSQSGEIVEYIKRHVYTFPDRSIAAP